MSKEEQKAAAMDNLFKGLTSPSAPPTQKEEAQPSATAPLSVRQKKYKEENERVCTIMEVEVMNKLRYISGKEGIALRDLFGTGARMLINEYEKCCGEIRARKSKPKKGDISKLFKV